MKNNLMMKALFAAAVCFCGSTQAFTETQKAAPENMHIGVVNFKECVEKSKQGIQEKNSFDMLKNQMMETLQKSEKELSDIAQKLEDQEYMDGLSPAAEEELKIKFQQLSQDYSRYQNQYYQLLNQANYRMLQSMHNSVAQAAEEVRKDKKLTAIYSQDSFFAYDDFLDQTELVIAKMNANHEKEQGDESQNLGS